MLHEEGLNGGREKGLVAEAVGPRMVGEVAAGGVAKDSEKCEFNPQQQKIRWEEETMSGHMSHAKEKEEKYPPPPPPKASEFADATPTIKTPSLFIWTSLSCIRRVPPHKLMDALFLRPTK